MANQDQASTADPRVVSVDNPQTERCRNGGIDCVASLPQHARSGFRRYWMNRGRNVLPDGNLSCSD
jgi:hypothetical protein